MVSREDIDRVLAHIHRGSDLAFFFDELTSAAWLEPLRERSFFAEPPAPESSGDYVRYPTWAASRYLARVANQDPNLVCEIIQELPETGNPRIHEDFVRAATEMPPELAKELVPRIESWLHDRHLLLLPEAVADFILSLLESGATEQALRLARVLLAVEPEHEDDEPNAVLDDHELSRSLDTLWRPLAVKGGIATLRMFVDLLEAALDARQDGSERESYDDGSTIWRPDLEERTNRWGRYMAAPNALVDALIDTAELLAGEGSLEQVLETLDEGEALVVRRLALHVLDDHHESATREILKREILQHESFLDPGLEVEYLSALRVLAPRLESAELHQLIEWIRLGPRNAKQLKERMGEYWDEYLSLWQARRVNALGDSIPVEYRDWARELLRQHESSDLVPSRPRPTATWVGPTSPREKEELLQEPVVSVLGYLRTWEPSGEWAAPSAEGLGRTFAAAVADRANEFSRAARRMIGMEPVYVRSFLSGLRDAVANDQRVTWLPVLDLCKWITDQSPDVSDATWDYTGHDPGWGWAWTEVSRLLEAGLTDRDSRIPVSYDRGVRDLVLALLEHPEPTPEYEERFGGSNMDPSTMSINTTRGVAAHALVKYAWWRKAVVGIQAMHPSVVSALDRHSDVSHEPSLAVHSVFGRGLNLLHWVDSDWVESRVELIFPQTKDALPYWQSAWNAFVIFNHPKAWNHRALTRQYRIAVHRLEGLRERHLGLRDVVDGMASHVLAYYLWGLEDLRSDIMEEVFSGPSDLRAALIRNAGRALTGRESQLSDDQAARLVRLWESRRESLEAIPITDDVRSELQEFAWWSGSPHLDAVWWMRQVKWVTKRAGALNPASLVIETLAETAAASPRLAIEALQALATSLDEPWLIQGHRDEVERVLELAMEAPAIAVREAATRLVHDLGARELADFSHLLELEQGP